VDDFADWRLRVRQIVDHSAKIVAATEKAVQLPPDIVIPDLNMRGRNGIETGKRIRERTRSTAIVFLTEIIDADIRLEAWVSVTLTC